MLTLLSVRLINWRMIKDSTFVPLAEGITGIAGRNGAGKSTFLDGVLWALYGLRPDGVPVSSLRREQSSVSDECSVTVEFLLDGHKIKVVRELKGKNNTSILNTFRDDIPATITSITPGEKWILEHLKIDANGFMTAFVVRQKELDALVTARPADRRATIERLSGIERMSQALKSAREEATTVKKTIDVIPGSEENVQAATEFVAEQEDIINDLADKAEQITRNGKQARQLLEKKTEIVENYKRAIQEKKIANEAVIRANRDIARINNAIADAEESYLKAKKVAVGGSQEELDAAETNVKALKGTHRTLLEKEQDRLSVIRHLEYVINSILENIAIKDREKNNALESISQNEGITPPSDAEFSLAEANVTSFEEKITNIHALILERRFKRTGLDKSLEALSASHDNSCPTCHTALDDPENLKSSFMTTIDVLTKEIDDLENQKTGLQVEFSQAKDVLSSLQEKKRVADQSVHTVSLAQEKVKELDKDIDSLTKKIQESQEEMRIHNENDEFVLAIAEINEKITLAEETLNNIKQAFLAQQWVDITQGKLKEHQEELIQSQEELLLAQKRDQEIIIPDDDEVQFADDELVAAQKQYNLALEEHHQNDAQLRVIQERLANAQRALTKETDLLNAKTVALEDLSKKTAVADILDEFRKAQIARIAPELSETATALISAMTNGKYTEVLLDDDFTPSVINAHGETRPVTWLSGGEVSVVALALRVAIADLITGTTGGMLWLDEILTAQDAERRANLINTLRSREGSQIVMINHTQDASDIVDKTINVVEEDGGSSIVES